MFKKKVKTNLHTFFSWAQTLDAQTIDENSNRINNPNGFHFKIWFLYGIRMVYHEIGIVSNLGIRTLIQEGIHEFGYSGVQVLKYSGTHVFMYSCILLFMYSSILNLNLNLQFTLQMLASRDL